MGRASDGGKRTRAVLDRVGARLSAIGDENQEAEPAYSIIDRLRHVHEAPLRNLRHSLWWIRKTFFTKQRVETPAFLVELTKPEVERLFGRHHFEPGWELSYNYLGEVLNLRRVVYVDDRPYEWWQVHIRGYHHDDGGIELTAHFETEPSEHPDAHVEMYGLDVDRGMGEIQPILDEEGVDYERLDPSETSRA